MTDFPFVEMLQNVLPRYREVVDPGDRVLIISDTSVELVASQVFAAAARVIGAHPTICLMTPLPRDYMDPPAEVVKAAEAADVLHYCASTALVHSKFGVRMMKELKKRRINSDNVNARMLVEGAILAKPEEIRPNMQKVFKYWDSGKQVHLTTPLGTDLQVSIAGRTHFKGHEVRHIQFPGGEAMIPPLEDTAEGVLVVDKCIHFIGEIKTPIRITVEKGWIKNIEGGDEARRFRRWLEENADKNGWRLCEISVGTNPKAFWMGSPRQDRFILGSSHVGFGLNIDVGGTIDSNIHYDGIISNPTIRVDGTLVVKDGEIVG